MKQQLTYKDAGVDVAAGQEAVEEIKDIVKTSHRPEVLSSLGGFAGLFDLSKMDYEQAVLVAGTDGVGTKLKLAFLADYHKSVGIDLVAMCVNDILAQGAQPLFFLDYIASSKIEASKIKDIVSGIAKGCKLANCAILGGETAEMPGFYKNKEYDLAGFAVGIAEKDRLLPKASIKSGDLLIGLASSGVHSNGFSLVRKIVFDKLNLKIDSYIEELGGKIADILLTPTKIYVSDVYPLIKEDLVKGIVHITGGGFYENIPRMLGKDLKATIIKDSWPITDIFKWLANQGNVAETEMFSTFNMGIGLVLAIDPKNKDEIMAKLNKDKTIAYEIGFIKQGQGVSFE